MEKPQKILLTGATGYLGSRLLPQLLVMGSSILVTVRPQSDLTRIRPYLSGPTPRVRLLMLGESPLHLALARNPVNVVIHCATDYGRPHFDETRMREANVLFPQELFEAAIQAGASVIVNTDTALPREVSAYAAFKHELREKLTSWSKQARILNLRLEHFYGPGDDEKKFITWALRALLRQEPRLNLTAGDQKRDFIHIDDVVRAYAILLHRLNKISLGCHHFDLGSGTSLSIRNFLLLAKELTGNQTTDLRFGAIPLRQHEPSDIRADIQPLEDLGWMPLLSLEEGLRQTIREERWLLGFTDRPLSRHSANRPHEDSPLG